ncbi:hypothetical protein KM043_001748 [Ampulex compressa]|nr:hypothetical protein KM043_001748 [Ampulex compressa]
MARPRGGSLLLQTGDRFNCRATIVLAGRQSRNRWRCTRQVVEFRPGNTETESEAKIGAVIEEGEARRPGRAGKREPSSCIEMESFSIPPRGRPEGPFGALRGFAAAKVAAAFDAAAIDRSKNNSEKRSLFVRRPLTALPIYTRAPSCAPTSPALAPLPDRPLREGRFSPNRVPLRAQGGQSGSAPPRSFVLPLRRKVSPLDAAFSERENPGENRCSWSPGVSSAPYFGTRARDFWDFRHFPGLESNGGRGRASRAGKTSRRRLVHSGGNIIASSDDPLSPGPLSIEDRPRPPTLRRVGPPSPSDLSAFLRCRGHYPSVPSYRFWPGIWVIDGRGRPRAPPGNRAQSPPDRCSPDLATADLSLAESLCADPLALPSKPSSVSRALARSSGRPPPLPLLRHAASFRRSGLRTAGRRRERKARREEARERNSELAWQSLKSRRARQDGAEGAKGPVNPGPAGWRPRWRATIVAPGSAAR